MNKPHSDSCDENREPILALIEPLFADRHRVLEIGSGTGQHAVYFAARMPHLTWHSSDRAEGLPGIRLWLAEAGLANTPAPLEFDVSRSPWPALEVDAVFSANTTHIMHLPEVEAMFVGIGGLLPRGGLFALYGPFNYGGRYTSDSNARFDRWLRQRDPQSGVRDFEALDRLATTAGMWLLGDHAMPANNRGLCWRKG